MRGLKAMRRRAGITAADLAERMHYSRTTIYFWEQGRCWPSSQELPRIAEILGCSIDELFADPSEELTPEKEETP